MIDLDNFKPVNDTYGHAAGDQMLLDVRDVLLSTCRRSDFVIRWGGDEFLVIAKQTKPAESEAMAERIRATIAETNFMVGDGQVVRTTCSIGFAAYPLFNARIDESALDQIIGLADGLMYESKKRRNAWSGMFTPTSASTSFEVLDGELEPTSLLFRAKRAGKLLTHYSEAETNSVAQFASGSTG
jgi:diguanylate cyclase (GGDEF)-like protein